MPHAAPNVTEALAKRVVRLSVIIRVRNEARALDSLFAALRAQKCSFPWEIVVVDNDSEDDTRKVAEQARAKVVRLAQKEFTYGRALNVGLRAACGDLALLLSAHALPIGSSFLEKLTLPFSDPQVAAARCLSSQDAVALQAWYKPKTISYASRAEQEAAEAGRGWTRVYPAATCS